MTCQRGPYSSKRLRIAAPHLRSKCRGSSLVAAVPHRNHSINLSNFAEAQQRCANLEHPRGVCYGTLASRWDGLKSPAQLARLLMSSVVGPSKPKDPL